MHTHTGEYIPRIDRRSAARFRAADFKRTHRSAPRWWTPTRTSYPLSAPRCSSSAALTKSPPTPFESSSHSTTTTSPTSRSYAAINQSIKSKPKPNSNSKPKPRRVRAESSRVAAPVCVCLCHCVREHPLVRECRHTLLVLVVVAVWGRALARGVHQRLERRACVERCTSR